MDPPAAPTILLIEDEAPTARAVARVLGRAGYHLWHAENAADARAMVRHQRPDLIVLDLSLPDVDGLVLCTWLRAEAPSVPILACSDASARERVLCLQLGAEDVLAKPFDLHELEARVRIIIRRTRRPVEPEPLAAAADSPPHPPATSAGQRSTTLAAAQGSATSAPAQGSVTAPGTQRTAAAPGTQRSAAAPGTERFVAGPGAERSVAGPGAAHFGPTPALPRPAAAPDLGGLRVDVVHWRVTLDGRRLDLTPTEFQLLAFLSQRAGQVVAREAVAQAVWGDASMSRSRTVDAYARRLRAKLDVPGGPRLMSVRGFGFVLVGPLPSAA